MKAPYGCLVKGAVLLYMNTYVRAWEDSTLMSCEVKDNIIFSPGYPEKYDYAPRPCVVTATELGTLTSPVFQLGHKTDSSGQVISDFFKVGLYRDGELNEYTFEGIDGPNVNLRPGDYISFASYFGTTGGVFELLFTPVAPKKWGSQTCFSGSDTVTLEGGGTKAMAEVEIGDRILSADREGNFAFSPVVFLPHGSNTHAAPFLEVTTSGGKTLRMTKNHLLPLAATGALVPASTLLTGHAVRTVDGTETVANVTEATSDGVFTAVTEMVLLHINQIPPLDPLPPTLMCECTSPLT